MREKSIFWAVCLQSDKNWIVQMATTNIQQLQRCKEELGKRNMELESILSKAGSVKWSRLRLRVANPTSGVDSMLEVLKCLQSLGLKTRNIQSRFSAHEFSVEVEIENKVVSSLSLHTHTHTCTHKHNPFI